MEKKNYEHIGIKRYMLSAPRECSLGVITFNKREWIKHTVRIINASILGIGIESNQRIEPGLVWFKERVSGFKCGVLRWNAQNGPPFGAGIEFISLSRDEEQYIKKQTEHSRQQKQVPDPELTITRLLKNIREAKSQGLDQ